MRLTSACDSAEFPEFDVEVEDGIDPALLMFCEVDVELEDGIDLALWLVCKVGRC